eukprot:289272-Rhodomonas_salina.1
MPQQDSRKRSSIGKQLRAELKTGNFRAPFFINPLVGQGPCYPDTYCHQLSLRVDFVGVCIMEADASGHFTGSNEA